MSSPLFLGLDISTTQSKALLIDAQGSVVAVASSSHSLSSPHPLWSEQDPKVWWSATVTAIRDLLSQSGDATERIQSVGLTGQMHGLVLLDESGEVLRPAILWNDQRTQEQCEQIHERVGRERLIQISGNLALTGFTAPKILWVRQHEPDIYAHIHHILLPKDYIRYRLTGEAATDVADGSGTILFDLKQRDWSAELIEALEIDGSWLPRTLEGTTISGEISARAASVTGLKAGTTVMAGASDQAAGAVGMGLVEPGVLGLTLGTSGVVFAPTPAALIEPEGRLHAFCHGLPDMWHVMGVMLSAAGSLAWFRDEMAPTLSFDELMSEAAGVPPGAEGLFYLPYLSGERTPHGDPLARGAFVGLTLRHGRAEMTRAILEGVASGLKDSFELVRTSGVPTTGQLRISGGGVRSGLWREIIAGVLDRELVSVNTTEGAAYGAALLAGVGVGAWPDVQSACRETIRITERTAPEPALVERYHDSYGIYRDLYPALHAIFPRLGS